MTDKTNFQKVVEFNQAFGLPHFDKPYQDVWESNPHLVQLRLSLIEEEVNELKQSIKEKNMTETLDALADILYVVYGAGSSFGLDLDKAFDLVHKSNMSKLCETEEIAIQTVENYKKHHSDRYDSPTYRKSKDGKYWVVYNQSTGKILKSFLYNPVKFDSIL